MSSLIKNLSLAAAILITCLPLLVSPGHAAQDTPSASTVNNALENHPSPYLALHGNDPVAWQEWGQPVLDQAKKENKLILLSSGYFSCHWCHVMQRESYQDPQIAERLNQAFIAVKIDRELEPALDKRLMAYAQATLKRGGWPLNVFISPDGIPVYAVLYQPPAQFNDLLKRLTVVWQEQSTRIRELALQEKIPVSFPDSEPRVDTELASELHRLAVEGIMATGDDIQGGFGQSNKFPSAPQLEFLLESLNTSRNPEVIEFLELSLDAMADNGMRDHLGNGFYRYVVDPGWEIPHFEKMLYDNANLAQLYLKAGQILDKPRYIDTARSTLDFMMHEMSDKNGVLYASFSAVDEHDIEGGYYLWTTSQVKSLLDELEYAVFSRRWQTERPVELEGGNHLRSPRPVGELANALNISESQVLEHLASARAKLIAARSTRVLPTDDKLLAAWNGLALSAFAEAAIMLDEDVYRRQAEKLHEFLVNTLWQQNSLHRSLAAGRLLGSASVEDYAYVSRGMFDYARLSGRDEDYKQAERVLAQGWERFYSGNAWSYADRSLLPPADGKEMLNEDSSASPSATLIATTLEMHHAAQLDQEALHTRALSALNRGEETLRRNPFWYVSQISTLQLAASRRSDQE